MTTLTQAGVSRRLRQAIRLATPAILVLSSSQCLTDFVSAPTGPGDPADFQNRPGSPTRLVFSLQPSAVVAGRAIGVEVAALDAEGDTATGWNGGEVTIALGGNPGGAQLLGSVRKNASGGKVIFNDLSIERAASGYTLVASTRFSGPTAQATSTNFEVRPGAGRALSFAVQPVTTGAGTAIPPVQVRAWDEYGNGATGFSDTVSVSIAGGGPAGALTGETSVKATGGVATLSALVINSPGNYVLAAAAAGLNGSTSDPFNIVVGPPARLAFTAQPTAARSGVNITPAISVEIRDAAGNLTTSSEWVKLALAANPGNATLDGVVAIQASNGVANFSQVRISAPGIGYTLTTFSESSPSLTASTSNAFNVAGPPARLAFTVQPTGAVAQTAIAPAVRVTVEDAVGQLSTSPNVAVTLAIGANPGSATLGGTATVTSAAGVATFSSVNVPVAGSGYTLTASATGLTAATSAPFDVAAFGTAARLAFVTQPSNAISAASIAPPIAVAVQDAVGNVVANSSAQVGVALAANPGTATLDGTLTANAMNGVAAFTNVSVSVPGTGYTLAATSAGLTEATSTTFNVLDPAAPFKLAFIQQPTGTTAGAAIAPAITVAVQTSAGTTVTGDNTTVVTLATASGPAPLRGTLSATAINGVASFTNVSDTAAGDFTLRASAPGLASAVSAPFTLGAGFATRLRFATQPVTTTAGIVMPTTVQVDVADQFGNRVPGASNSIQVILYQSNGYPAAFGVNPLFGSGTAMDGDTIENALNGTAAFTALRPRSIQHCCTGETPPDLFALGASSPGLTGARSSAFILRPAPPVRLAVWQPPPATVTARVPFTVSIALVDSLGNSAAIGGETVSMSLTTAPPGAHISGTTSANATPIGRAVLNPSVDSLGAYVLTASLPDVIPVSTPPLTATSSTAAQLGFVVSPSNVTAAAVITPAPRVCVLDAYLNEVRNATGSVTVAIASNPGDATLGGTLTRSLSSGCADFADLTVSAAGSGYRLSATATGVSGVSGSFTSLLFNVTP